MDAELLEWRDQAVGIARSLLEQEGRLQPVLILWRRPQGSDPGEDTIIGMSYVTEEEKDSVAAGARLVAAAMRATAALHITEVWMYPEGADPHALVAQGITPERCPNRREAVLIALEAGDRYLIAVAPIDRSSGGPTFGEPEWMELDAKSVSGRFMRWLPQADEPPKQ